MDVIYKPETHYEKWMEYMLSRRGDYAFRSRTRYAAVADVLFAFGLNDSHIITDIGAGSCQFMHYLSRERGWMGRYHAVDAVICGADLNTWRPKQMSDFMVCIEVLEHLHSPEQLLDVMNAYTRFAAVATTPNPEAVDVIACDPTHVSVIDSKTFGRHGWHTWRRSFFGVPHDTLLACNRLPNYATIIQLGADNEIAYEDGIGNAVVRHPETQRTGLPHAARDVQPRPACLGNISTEPMQSSGESNYSRSSEGEPQDDAAVAA